MNPANVCCRCAEPDAFPSRPHFSFALELNGVWRRTFTVCQACGEAAMVPQIMYPIVASMLRMLRKEDRESEALARLSRKEKKK